jgi:hypothetical protein
MLKAKPEGRWRLGIPKVRWLDDLETLDIKIRELKAEDVKGIVAKLNEAVKPEKKIASCVRVVVDEVLSGNRTYWTLTLSLIHTSLQHSLRHLSLFCPHWLSADNTAIAADPSASVIHGSSLRWLLPISQQYSALLRNSFITIRASPPPTTPPRATLSHSDCLSLSTSEFELYSTLDWFSPDLRVQSCFATGGLRQSFRLGAKALETHDQRFFQRANRTLAITSSLKRRQVCPLWTGFAFVKCAFRT